MRLTSVRMLAMFAAFVILAGAIVGRFFHIQVIKHEHYERIAQCQQYKPSDTPAKRGTIYDRFLRPLAVTLPAMEVFVDPHLVTDTRSVARQLSARTGESYASIF